MATVPSWQLRHNAEDPVGWSKVQLNPGESKEVTVVVPQLYLSIYDVPSSSSKVLPGSYTFMAGGSSQDLPLTKKVELQ